MAKDDETTEEWLEGLETAKELNATDASDLRAIGGALLGIDAAENALTSAVLAAREAGRSWTEIANVLGVSRQAARQRFAAAVAAAPGRDVRPGDTLVITNTRDTFVITELAAPLAASSLTKDGTTTEDVERFLTELSASNPASS